MRATHCTLQKITKGLTMSVISSNKSLLEFFKADKVYLVLCRLYYTLLYRYVTIETPVPIV